ncbi:MAG: flavin reductase [Oscillospiraceae bacterium]|nr:flavin reductase [Oscillospiraceae bacterium]MBQ1741691.1 flavin reductase [Oscillospiraceae bacterium]MBQ1805531.1 flavin reductase [Oscillospiraceae bacterium]MBQ5567048.1 flavin reductase [Oscillospiraceae bacterium]
MNNTIKESFALYNKRWALVTAGRKDSFNTMTISWGGLGTLWNRDVATVYIRPERYTYRFLNENERFTISFFPEQYREDLMLLGTLSGRDGDKLAKTKLTARELAPGVMGFEQAKVTLVCRKIFWQDMDKANIDPAIAKQVYANAQVHRIFIGEVEQVLTQE